MYKRTHTCGGLRSANLGDEVALNGWINTVRLHGQVVFVDLRDRYGMTQLVFNADRFPDNFEAIKKLSMEDVISIKGVVQARAAEAINLKLATGEIEVAIKQFLLLNEADAMPFRISDRDSATEEHRLKYRYLELRTEELLTNLLTRHSAYQSVRKFLSSEEFVEVETPVLMKSTPEGARDYLVPSRIHPGKFYALPQSPQTYKQLLMIAGLDRYFQIVKCFRDEDLRADRQPEFTQIDLEMSFVEEGDVQGLCERLIRYIFKSVINADLPDPFPVLSYKDVLESYGTDKPDLRFDLPLKNLKSITDQGEFKAFHSVETVKGIMVPDGASFTRKVLDELTDFVRSKGAKGLAWTKMDEGHLIGGVSKFFSPDLQKTIIESLGMKDGDILLMVGDNTEVALQALGALRNEIADRQQLIKKDEFKPLWVVEFPLVGWDDDQGRYVSMHHPFTAPMREDIHMLDSDPAAVRSQGYDLVINGYEIAGGSIRIHQRDLQSRIFNLLGIGDKEAQDKFGFLLEAFKYGAPPHGGIAVGYDRLVMLLAGTNNIRDVIAFPKTTSALSLMDNSPSSVSDDQLDELGITLKSLK